MARNARNSPVFGLGVGQGAGNSGRQGSSYIVRAQHMQGVMVAGTNQLFGIMPCDPTHTLLSNLGVTREGFTISNIKSIARLTLPTTPTRVANTNWQRIDTTEGGFKYSQCAVEFLPAIASVQYGSVTCSNASATGTATINSVDTTRAIVIHLGSTLNTNGWPTTNYYTNVVLTNATTVTATRSGTTTDNITNFCVVEFAASVIQSVQHKTFTSTANVTSETDTITAVNAANTILLYNGQATAVTGQGPRRVLWSAVLTNGTTVTFTRNNAGAESRTHAYIALEFATGVVKQVQQGTTLMSAAQSNTTTLTTPVDPTKTWLVSNGVVSTDTTTTALGQIQTSLQLESGSTLKAFHPVAGAFDYTPAWTALTFN